MLEVEEGLEFGREEGPDPPAVGGGVAPTSLPLPDDLPKEGDRSIDRRCYWERSSVGWCLAFQDRPLKTGVPSFQFEVRS